MVLEKIGIDVENGDKVGDESVTERMVPAVHRFMNERPGVDIFLHGEKEKIKNAFGSDILNKVEVVPASKFYSQADKIVRPTEGSVLNNLAVAVHNKEIDGYLSIGDTSKIVVESSKMRTKGIARSLVAILPSIEKDFVFSDIGLSVPRSKGTFYSKVVGGWVRDIYTQGLMATVYVRGRGVDIPRWGIVSNGTEDHKGSDVDNRLEELILLAQDQVGLGDFVEYVGKIEPNDCFRGKVDVALTDGYKGNLLLKSFEGAFSLMGFWARQEVAKFSRVDKVRLAPGAGVVRRVKDNFMDRANPDKYNGAIVLGYDGVIAKGHGNSSIEGIYFGLCNLADCTKEDSGVEMAKVVQKYIPKK